MLGADGAVWLATQAIGNDAVRPSPAGQMSKLFTDEPLAPQFVSPLWAGRLLD
jgi:hypothetical protein